MLLIYCSMHKMLWLKIEILCRIFKFEIVQPIAHEDCFILVPLA